jgi:hypothetical protein
MKKSLKKTFLIFWVFLKNRFCSNRKKVFPLFLQNGWTDRVENFFMSSSAKLGCVFFCFFQMWFQKNLGAFTKFLRAEKKVFDSIFSILLLLTFVDGIFQKKKHAPRLGCSYHKKISARYYKVPMFCGWGWKFWWFLALGTSKTLRRRSLGILSLRQLLLYSSRSNCPLSFINFRSAIP